MSIRLNKSVRELWAAHVVRMVETRVVYRILVGELDERRPVRKSRHSQEDNFEISLKEDVG
jgi:hypothetical protein